MKEVFIVKEVFGEDKTLYAAEGRRWVQLINLAKHFITYEEAKLRIQDAGEGSYQIDKLFIV